MRIISNLFNRRKVWSALLEYPVYSPPFHEVEVVLLKSEIKSNFDYFMQQKASRLCYLAKFMARFSIDLHLTQEALQRLDSWLYRYSAHLIPRGEQVIDALSNYEPAWDGECRGLNVMHDIAIFAGEYIVSKNKDVHWDVWYGNGAKYDCERAGFGQPCLYGLCHFGYDEYHSMLFEIYRCCEAGFGRLRHGSPSPMEPWDNPGEFVRRLNYLANPNPQEPVPISQLNIDSA